MYHVALIGYGYWGVNLLRNLISNASVNTITVCDIKNERLDIIRKNHPTIHITTDYQDILKNPEIDIVVIATPTSTHYHLAKAALTHEKHALVEKPLCTKTEEAIELYALAESKNKILFTDLTFLYNGAVEYIHDYISNNKIGTIKYIDSTRVNLGIYQADTNVVWDLATHDISIIQKLIGQSPTHVRAISSHTQENHTDLAYIFLYYPDELLVHINCSWASPTKIRQMIIGGEKRMIIYDEVEPTQKIKIYDYAQTKQIENRSKSLVDYRLGDISIPKFSTTEPLKNMLDIFLECVEENKYKTISPQESIEIIRILECIEKSLDTGGELITF